ncbi:hypothetical protein [Ruficoccus sp. ZRK36]|uniref:hypothetical protein n=1 Tax=Ruficoccus sp. ZRK36 TaxID=2866311 RepID=UPI001C72C616|nr:hypothetical protein [Ruficoccus sp. ZRK36]QYY35181.1 hypothetical protein K0V07_12850 [Ruficoccus sp. ZRK36]
MSNLKRFSLILTAAALAATTLTARIGEKRSELEGRMLSGRNAVKLPSRSADILLGLDSVPYRTEILYFPEGSVQEVYYKLAEDGQATTSDLEEGIAAAGNDKTRRRADSLLPPGWIMHVVYVDNVSVFESYRRCGEKMSRYEEKGILKINQDESEWKRVSSKDAEPSAFGYNMVREDGEVRALTKGSYMLVFDTDFDLAVFDVKEEASATQDVEAQGMASVSLEGF